MKLPKKKQLCLITCIMIVCIVLFTVAINQRIRICVGDDHCSYIRGIRHSSGFEAMTTWYKYIPEELLLSFEKSGYTVCFEGFGMFPDYGDENIVGSSCFKDPNCKGILIRNDGTTKIDMNFVIAHEFGHYFDYILGDVSNSSEWISITEKESVNSQSNLYIDNTHNYYNDPDEFFAEQCAYLFTGNDSDYEAVCCPEAQAFVSQLLEEYIDQH